MFAVSGLLCDYGKHFISYDLLFIMIFVGIEIYEMKFTSHFFKKLKYHEIAIYFKHFFYSSTFHALTVWIMMWRSNECH